MKIDLKPNKSDIFVGSFLLILVISLIISLVSLKHNDDHYVYVKYDRVIIHQMDLHKDEIFVINGKVAITKNVCPEEFCKHMGWIDTKGYSLICAPNRLVIEIGQKVDLDCDWGVC